jgi:SAM-dependent methyltransferase
MAQTTSGVRSVLSMPIVYDTFQEFTGASRSRRRFVAEDIRPFPGCRILDIGCGTARILDFLPADARYVGFDSSAVYIDSAVSRYRGRAEFFCAELGRGDVKGLGRFDIVLASGVLHHLDDGPAAELAAIAAEALADSGRLVTIDPCYAPGQTTASRFLVSRDRGQNVREPAAYVRLAEGAFARVEGRVRHQAWIPYTHWIMQCHA